jgi:hypothetical protein
MPYRGVIDQQLLPGFWSLIVSVALVLSLTPQPTGAQVPAGGISLESTGGWDALFFAPHDPVILGMAVDERGYLYVEGRFDQISGIRVPGFAGWDGKRWYSLGTSVTAMAPAPGGGLYGAVRRGDTQTVLMRWVDRRWVQVGSPFGLITVHEPWTLDVPVQIDHIVAGDDSSLYVSGCTPRGRFEPVGPGILHWDGSRWVRIPNTPDCVRYIQHAAGHLFAQFDNAFHRWDAARQEWDRVAEIASHFGVRAIDRNRLIAVDGSDKPLLCAGGDWTTVQLPVEVNSIGLLGAGMDGLPLLTVNTDEGAVVIGFDGERWNTLAPPVRGWGAEAHSDRDGNIYLRGLLMLNGDMERRVVRWDGREWHGVTRLGLGATGVNSVVVDRAGELFVHLDPWNDKLIGDQVGRLVRWTGDGWQRIDPGEGEVYDITGGPNSDMCADMRVRSGISWSSISMQCWQDGAWVTREPFPCPDNETNAFWRILATDRHGREYVSFRCGEETGVALREEGVWSILGHVTFPPGSQNIPFVRTAAADDAGGLYIGGMFAGVGETTDASAVAYWDGSQWHSLAGGLTVDWLETANVKALAWHDGVLYAGGEITGAGPVPVSYVAAWDGARWTQVGEGFNERVLALVVDNNGILYAGGDFNYSGTRHVDRIARWDGDSWAPLAGGISGGAVYTLAIDAEGALWAGGEFTSAGGHATLRIARWIPADDSRRGGRLFLEDLEVYPNPTTGWVDVRFSVPAPGPYTGTLYDVLGRQIRRVFSADLPLNFSNMFWIDTSGLASGTYYLVIQGSGVRVTVPILRIHP